MKGTQKYERIIWKKGVVALALHGPYYLGARNRLLAHWPEHNNLFSLHEVSSSVNNYWCREISKDKITAQQFLS